jgi:hypothetical protein
MFCAECRSTLVLTCHLLAGERDTLLCFACLQKHNNTEEICWNCDRKSKPRYNLSVNFIKLNASLLFKCCSTSCHLAQVEYVEQMHRVRDASKDLYRECMFCGKSGQNLIRCPKRKIYYYCNEKCLRSDVTIGRR